jgi:hypothetical protein
VRDALPPGGLFADMNWRIAAGPFVLTHALAKEIESIGRVLLQFYRAANLLYRRSAEGKAPAWVAQWLDQGKPESLLRIQRDAAFRNEIPRVIRPDFLVTENGLALTELDSVPGGIGLTTWLYEAYEPGQDANGACGLGSAEAMKTGFRGIFGDAARAHIIVSEESATYRPEMEWLATRISDARLEVHGSDFTDWKDGDAVYRFFELFDLDRVPAANAIFEAAREKRIRLTPPPKPLFEEKLLFALLWNRNLRDWWRQELGQAFFERLLGVVPRTWAVDPAPIPPHAAIPDLGLTDWQQLKALSQRDRDLILKISGYSEDAWGARGVYLGSDLNAADWSAAVDRAVGSWAQSPFVLQRYHRPTLVETAWFDFERNTVEPMKGRARLCPFYFVHGDAERARANLGGVLATICPADKKIIHGMRDAVLAPCATPPRPSDPSASASARHDPR